jgi:hypothetical protein
MLLVEPERLLTVTGVVEIELELHRPTITKYGFVGWHRTLVFA